MRRWLYVAAFSLILLTLPVWAQRRGGGGGGAHFASGGGHSFAGYSSGGRSSGASYSGNYGRGSGGRVNVRPTYRRRTFYGSRFYYPYGLYYPYAGYYPWYSDSFNDQSDGQSAYADANNPGPYPSDNDSGLQRDVQALNGKIDRLQADVEARNHPKNETEPATALVFRDQHVEEVHNYAIAGGTLWVLSDQAAKKIPLAQLDIPATVKMNDDRGVDFQVPSPALSIQIVR